MLGWGRNSAALVAALVVSAGAQTGASAQKPINWDRVDLAAEREGIEAFQTFDQVLQNVGWRLVQGNAGYCESVIPSIGLQMQDMASYGAPQIAARALGLAGDFAVQTAAKGSPAALSGALPQNREIASIAGTDPNAWDAGDRFEWERLARAHDLVDAALAQNGSVEITFADGDSATVDPVPVCASRFELMGDGDIAVANGKRVVIGIEFPAFQYEEAEFAAVVAHELAHNLLDHTAWLDRNGRKRRHTRLTESEADRLMPWLLVNAGYDPEGAARFLKEFRPYSGGLLFIGGTHPRWQKRLAAVETEIAQIRELRQQGEKADWRTHFRREIDPGKGLAKEEP